MATEASEVTGGYKTPPYVAFKTFNTLIEDLKEHGLPTQIDRSVLRRFSGGVGSQLVSALRALRLITDDNKPTTWLQALVAAHGTDEYKTQIRNVLATGYPYLGGLDLRTATPSQFAEAFKLTGAKEEVLRKSRTFYLHAAQFAGVEVGSRLLAGGTGPRKPAGGAGAPRKKLAPKTGKVAAALFVPEPTPTPAPTASAAIALEYQIVDILKMEGIGDEETAAVFTLVKFLATKKQGGGTASTAP